MKLNPDCIRAVLMDVERRSSFDNFIMYVYPDDFKNLSEYPRHEVLYHLRQCYESGFLIGKFQVVSNGCIVKDLSPKGHEFIANIRSESNWRKTKETATKVGSFSLDVLKDISAQIISNLISSQFNK